jgi:hypothetical protein
VRNLGRLVWMPFISTECKTAQSLRCAYIYIEFQDWVFAPGPLQARYLAMELVLGALRLLACAVIALRLLVSRLTLRRRLLLLGAGSSALGWALGRIVPRF